MDNSLIISFIKSPCHSRLYHNNIKAPRLSGVSRERGSAWSVDVGVENLLGCGDSA